MAEAGEGVAGWLLRMPQERLVASGRVTLAAVSIVAVHLDPLQPARGREAVFALLGGYLLFAVVVLVRASRGSRRGWRYLIAHAVDIVVIGTMIVLTAGPTSPYFVLLSFILLSATLQWDWRVVLVTGLLLTLLYAGMTGAMIVLEPGVNGGQMDELLVRSSYLLIATGLFAYFGAYRALSRTRLAQLAAWPSASASDDDSVRVMLSHASRALAVQRIVAVWEEQDEPSLTVVVVGAADRLGRERIAPERHPGLAEALRDSRAYAFDARFPAAGGDGGIDEAAKALGITCGLAAPFVTEHFRGRVLLVGAAVSGPNELALATIVGARVGAELEQARQHEEIRRRSAAEERMRLADRLHSGMLQSVTAARLQIVVASGQVDGEAKERIEQVSRLLGEEQRQIRAFVDELAPAGRRDAVR